MRKEIAARFLHAKEEDVIVQGDDVYFIPDDKRSPRRSFISGLESLKVNLKMTAIPKVSPSEDDVDQLHRALGSKEPLFWSLVSQDLRRFDIENVVRHQHCKIIQGKYTGRTGYYSVLQDRVEKGLVVVILSDDGKHIRGAATRPTYVRSTFLLGDEVSGKTVNRKRVVGWLVRKEGEGTVRVLDPTTVSCSTSLSLLSLIQLQGIKHKVLTKSLQFPM